MDYPTKIQELQKYLGAWPPPFDPFWAIHLSQGRCGSNASFETINSFVKKGNRLPNYEAMGMKDNPDHSDNPRDWIPKSEFIYYNVHSLNAERLHFPVLFWLLENSPKIIYLRREDHLTRGISIHYANMAYSKPPVEPSEAKKFYETHLLDISELNEYVKISYFEIEIVKRIVKEFVPEDRLLEISHYDLFYDNTLETLRQVAGFLDIDTNDPKLSATMPLRKETSYHLIPNLSEITDKYNRDFKEQPFWIPNDLDMDVEEAAIDKRFQEIIMSSSNIKEKVIDNRSKDREKIPIRIKKPASENKFDIKGSQNFYLDEIPTSAKFLPFPVFRNLPNMSQNIQMLDDRWETLEWTSPDHLQEFTKVTDIQKNWDRSTYQWVCGFSVFFLKFAYDGHKDRIQPEKHQRLIRGVETLCSYPDRYEDMVLRFYVSEEVWEILYKSDVLYTPGTEFYKMAFSSEESQLGAIWRMLCLSDGQFEYAIETDVAPDENWIFMRIQENGLNEFKSLLLPDKDYMSEFLIWEHNWYNDDASDNFKPDHIHTPHIFWDIGNLDFASGGGITTRPNQMPDIEPLIWRFIENYATQRNFYHAESDVWTATHQRKFFIPYGWEGFPIDQEFWRYLKKVKPIRHFLVEKSIKHIQNTQIHENHIMHRIISQLLSEGSEFVHFKTKENVFSEV